MFQSAKKKQLYKQETYLKVFLKISFEFIRLFLWKNKFIWKNKTNFFYIFRHLFL